MNKREPMVQLATKIPYSVYQMLEELVEITGDTRIKIVSESIKQTYLNKIKRPADPNTGEITTGKYYKNIDREPGKRYRCSICRKTATMQDTRDNRLYCPDCIDLEK